MRKVVLITGTSSGLGRTLTEILEQRDFKVYAASRSKQVFKRAMPLVMDITSDESVSKGVQKIIEESGKVDVLINNAGYTLAGSTEEFTSGEFKEILDTNTVGAFRLIRKLVPYMKTQGGGRIINVTSLNGIVSLPNFGLYSASKHALEALGDALRYELSKYNILVTNIVPGAIKRNGEEKDKNLPHKPAREKFVLLKWLLPMITEEKVAQELVSTIEATNPPARVLLGVDATLVSLLYRYLPNFLWDRLMSFVWNR